MNQQELAQQKEQIDQELSLVMALGQHKDPSGLFGLANIQLVERIGSKYALSESEWGLN